MRYKMAGKLYVSTSPAEVMKLNTRVCRGILLSVGGKSILVKTQQQKQPQKARVIGIVIILNIWWLLYI